MRLRREAKDCLKVCCSCINVSLSLLLFKAFFFSLSMGALRGEPERRATLLGSLENT